MNRAFTQMGNNTSKAFNRMGEKTNSVMNQTKKIGGNIQNIAGRLENTAYDTLDKTRNAVNKIPDLNEKAIKLSNTVIKKSGGITDVLRKSSDIGNKLIKGVNDMGGSDIPIIGKALKIAEKSTHQLAVGAKKLDNARDKADMKLNKYSEVSRNTIGDIEKSNSRKRAELKDAMAEPIDNYI